MALLNYSNLGNGVYKDTNNKYFKMANGSYKNATGQTVNGQVRQYFNPNQTLASSTQIGDNLYKDANGKYYGIAKGTYKDATGAEKYGDIRSYVEGPHAKEQQLISQLYDQQKQALLNQKKDLAPQYQAQRGQADVVNQQDVNRLRELMDSRGLGSSGENVTAQTGLMAQRQNALNSINGAEQQAYNNIDTQALQTDAQRTQALIDAQRNADQTDYQRAQDYANNLWRQFQYNNMSASDKAQLGLNKYQIDAGNQAQAGQNQALLDYYKSLGFNSSSKGSGAVPQSFQQDMATAIQKGVPAEWAPVLSEIVKRESSYNPSAKNPTSTAYGYGQFLDSTRKSYEKKTGLSYSDPVNQLIMMAQYVKDRYGTPQKALQFWKDNKYY